MTSSIQLGLGIYYLLVVLLNVGFVLYWAYFAKDRKQTLIGSIVTGVFLLHALIYLVGKGPAMPAGIRVVTTSLMGEDRRQAGARPVSLPFAVCPLCPVMPHAIFRTA